MVTGGPAGGAGGGFVTDGASIEPLLDVLFCRFLDWSCMRRGFCWMVRVTSVALLLDRPIVAYFFDDDDELLFRDESFLGFTGLFSSDAGAVALERFLGLAVLALGGLPSRGSMIREYL